MPSLRSILLLLAAFFATASMSSAAVGVSILAEGPAGPENLASPCFTPFNDLLYFVANGNQIWQTDGTAANTVAVIGGSSLEAHGVSLSLCYQGYGQVTPYVGNNGHGYNAQGLVLNQYLYFLVGTANIGQTLCRWQPGSTAVAVTPTYGAITNVYALPNGHISFLSNSVLYDSDGQPQPAGITQAVGAGTVYSALNSLVVGNYVYFLGYQSSLPESTCLYRYQAGSPQSVGQPIASYSLLGQINPITNAFVAAGKMVVLVMKDFQTIDTFDGSTTTTPTPAKVLNVPKGLEFTGGIDLVTSSSIYLSGGDTAHGNGYYRLNLGVQPPVVTTILSPNSNYSYALQSNSSTYVYPPGAAPGQGIVYFAGSLISPASYPMQTYQYNEAANTCSPFSSANTGAPVTTDMMNAGGLLYFTAQTTDILWVEAPAPYDLYQLSAQGFPSLPTLTGIVNIPYSTEVVFAAPDPANPSYGNVLWSANLPQTATVVAPEPIIATQGGSTEVEFNLTQPAATPVTLNFTIGGTALPFVASKVRYGNPSGDYEIFPDAGTLSFSSQTQGSITIPAGSTQGTISIAQGPDYASLNQHPTVTVTVTSSSPAIYIGAENSATVTMTCLPGVTFPPTSANAVEGKPGTAGWISVALSFASTTPVTIYYAASGTANATTGRTDYQPLPGSVTFPAYTKTASIPIIPVDNGVATGPLSVLLTLVRNAAYTSIPIYRPFGPAGMPSVQVFISDFEEATVSVTATIPAATYPNSNGLGASSGLFTVSRTGGTSGNTQPLSINFSTSTDPSYSIPSTLTIPAGAASATLAVTPLSYETTSMVATCYVLDSSAYNLGSTNIASVTISP